MAPARRRASPSPPVIDLKPPASHMAVALGDRPQYVPGRLIIRFAPGAIAGAAGVLAEKRSPRAAATALPEAVQGPIDYLRKRCGLSGVEPLFARQPRVRRRAPMSIASAAQPLVASVTDARRHALQGFAALTVEDRKLTDSVIATLKASRAVKLVERMPNRWLAQSSGLADPMRNLQWGLRAIRWFEADRPDSAFIQVAVLDTGIDASHPDLQGVVAEYNHAGNSARDYAGHGTHVAGIIAAIINNGVGIAGVTSSRLHVYKVFDDPGSGGKETPFDDLAYNQALAEVLDLDAVRVVNLSLGGTASSTAERLVLEALQDAGKLVVAAMGNEYLIGNPVLYPAAYPAVVAVGAVSESLRRAVFSNTGRHIGLVAPGDNILSTVPRVPYPPINPDADYASWPGTSMATPHVAGAAALVFASNPALTAVQVRHHLFESAMKVPGMRGRAFTPSYGHGLVNLETALS